MVKVQGRIRTPTVGNKDKNPDLYINFSFHEDEIGLRYAWRLRTGSDKLSSLCRHMADTEELQGYTTYYTQPSNFRSPESFMQDVYETINRAASTGRGEEQILEEIEKLGCALYDRLFPQEVQRIYWNFLARHNSPRRISIVIKSSVSWIPWELVRPYNQLDRIEDVFFCEKFDLARWISAEMHDHINLDHVKAIATSHLGAAQSEVEGIKEILGDKLKSESPNIQDVKNMLEVGDFSGLHFICHGRYNSDHPEYSELYLDGGSLRPHDINGKYTFFGSNKPFIFLNACETGQTSYALTGSGGWVDAFLRRGEGSGFIASIWEADDELACQFACAFYKLLLQGKPIAEAVRLARAELKKKNPSNPTWLAYTLYANPLARVSKLIEPDANRQSV